MKHEIRVAFYRSDSDGIILECECGWEAVTGEYPTYPTLRRLNEVANDHLDGAKALTEPYRYTVIVDGSPFSFDWLSHESDVAKVALKVRRELHLGNEAVIEVVQA